MPLILITGNGLTAISQKISDLKKGFDPLSIQYFSAKQVNFDQAVIGLSTEGLFSLKRLIILEDYDGEIDLEKLPLDPNVTIIIKILKNLPINSILFRKAANLKAQVFNFSEAEETSIFPFLDALAEKNPRYLDQFDALLAEWGGQYLLTMIFYLLRRMVQSPQKLPSFIKQKIAKQKQNFSTEKITQLYKEALETDFKIKSGLIEEKIGLTLLINKILTS